MARLAIEAVSAAAYTPGNPATHALNVPLVSRSMTME
jgi:hypothetical protein